MGASEQADMDNSLLDIEGVAALTGLSKGTLYHWVSQRRIPFVRLSSRCIRFRRSDIDAWLERLLVPVASDNTR